MPKTTILLLAITVLALAVRLYHIDTVPISLGRDEVGLGYDAYSIYRTGRDQYGKLWPLILRSSDDYKLGVYAYVAIPAIAIFGLNSIAIRLPSAIFGALTVFFSYHLGKKIWQETTSDRLFLKQIALFGAFFLAISPWHIQYSRTAYEVNLALFFFVIGLSFLQRSQSSWYSAIIASLFLGLTLYTYHAFRIITPVVLIIFLFLQRKKFAERSKFIILGIFAILTLAIVPGLLSKGAQIRFTVLNVFTMDNQLNESFKEKAARELSFDLQQGANSGSLVHNRKIATLRFENVSTFFKNFTSYFSAKNLLAGDDRRAREWNHASGYGLVHWWEYVLLVVGFCVLIKTSITRQSGMLIVWLISSVSLAALGFDSPNSWRALPMIVPLVFLAALGLAKIASVIRQESSLFLMFAGLIFSGLIVWTLSIYLHLYHVHLNYEHSADWRYGRREAALFANSLKQDYRKIVVSPKLDDPHLYFLFHLAYDPATYLQEGGTKSGGWTSTDNHFDKFEFRPIDFVSRRAQPGVLLIGLPEEFPDTVVPLKTIYYLDGKEAIKIVQL